MPLDEDAIRRRHYEGQPVQPPAFGTVVLHARNGDTSSWTVRDWSIDRATPMGSLMSEDVVRRHVGRHHVGFTDIQGVQHAVEAERIATYGERNERIEVWESGFASANGYRTSEALGIQQQPAGRDIRRPEPPPEPTMIQEVSTMKRIGAVKIARDGGGCKIHLPKQYIEQNGLDIGDKVHLFMVGPDLVVSCEDSLRALREDLDRARNDPANDPIAL